MKFGGPWNLRGLRPEAREAARAAARRSGVSVGEWLNDVIQPDDDADDAVESRKFARDDARGGSARRGDSDYDLDDRPQQVRGRAGDRHQQHGERETPRSRDQERNAARERERAQERERTRERARQQEPARTQAGGRERVLEGERNREVELSREEEYKRERIKELEDERARELAAAHDRARERKLALEERGAPNHEAAGSDDDPGDLHGRLDKLSSQLDRLTRSDAVQRRLLSREARAPGESADDSRPRQTDAAAAQRRAARRTIHNRPPANAADLSIDQVVAEIAARQRALNGETAAATAAAAPEVSEPTEPGLAGEAAAPTVPPDVPAPASTIAAEGWPAEPVNIGGLEKQLRAITVRIEELRPSSEVASAVSAIRTDLADIARHLAEALPRQAVESIESEIKALSQRIDETRQVGGDAAAIAGLEQGLVEVRDALRGLTTAENLVGFDDAVKALNQKLDLIAAKDDPAALQQLETAIGALRGIVSHVASNETLNRVAEDVRALAAKVDDLADGGMNGHALSALEGRIDTLANALSASAEAGQIVPHELEKLLSGLIEKLEWVQLTHTDHAALAHLEDRIATLVQRFDASDARLIHLEAIERGIADLLVHLEGMRGNTSGAIQGAPLGVDAIERHVAEIKQSERRTQDSLEAVQGTVEHVVDRLARIESGMRFDPTDRSAAPSSVFEDIPLQPTAESMPAARAVAAVPATVGAEPASTRAAARRPIDPDLPPDHPLEPGSASGRTRPAASAADRIAASEAAVSSAKPPIIPDPGGKSDFIAAARRAAQAAAATPAGSEKSVKAEKRGLFSLPKGAMKRVRTLLVAGSAVLIAIACLHIATRMFLDGGSAPASQAPAEKASPTAATPTAADPTILPAPKAAQLPSHGTPPAAVPSAPPPSQPNSSAAPTASPAQQSRAQDGGDQTDSAPAPLLAKKPTAAAMPLWANPDITGSLLPRATPAKPLPAAAPTAPAVATAAENLPVAIGGPELRKAAASGDAAAAYEVAMRFADGRGVAQNDDQAAYWLQRAANSGLAPAQFRLGTYYEKGTGVKKDLAAARDLYLAAANKGNGKAMHNLAVLYAEGINGPPDYHTASVWFSKAADHGVADSEYNLAILYARGIGVPQSFADSYKWFALAAGQGDNEAAKKRDEVAGKLDPQALTAARLAVQTWSAQPQPDDAINVKVPAGGWDAAPRGAQLVKPKPHLTSAKAATGSATAVY
jgi:localization factor PodJL